MVGVKTLAPILFTIVLIAVCNSSNKITHVRFESCGGCSLKRLLNVRNFLYLDVSKYKNAEWKKIPGALPIAIFLDANDEEVERHDLSPLDRVECNKLLHDKGFYPTVEVENNEL